MVDNPIERLKAETDFSVDEIVLDPKYTIHVVERGVKIKKTGIEVTDYRSTPVKTGEKIFNILMKEQRTQIVVTWTQAQTIYKYMYKRGMFLGGISPKFYGKLAEKGGFLDWLIKCR